MNSVSAVDPAIRDTLLAEAANSRTVAELVVVRGENLQANLKSRFLRASGERVLMEVPTNNGHPALLQTGQFIEVYFKLGHERFGFDSRVVGYSRLELSDGVVDVIDIAPPHFLETRQRRKFSRVSVATLPPIQAQLWPIGLDARSGEAIEGRLCNLSAGGVAVLVDRQRWQFASDRQFRLAFNLPGDMGRFEFNTVVCHVRHVFHSRRQIIGLAFLPGSDAQAHRHAIDRIARFVEGQQRGDVFARRIAVGEMPVG
jgi:c-di-GMP-binding flagellar brake protein YcgR